MHDSPSNTSLEPENRKDALMSLFDETQELVGGDFENLDDPNPGQCTTADGREAVRYSLGRSASVEISMDEARALSESVTALWEERGYEMHRSFHEVLGYSIVGENDSRSVIEFEVNDHARSMSGESDCVPADIDAVRERLLNERTRSTTPPTAP